MAIHAQTKEEVPPFAVVLDRAFCMRLLWWRLLRVSARLNGARNELTGVPILWRSNIGALQQRMRYLAARGRVATRE